MAEPPEHSEDLSWRQTAQETPLFAAMSTERLAGAPPTDFSPEHLQAFFEKGEAVYREFLTDIVKQSPDPLKDTLVVEYGCGMGRLLKAAHDAGARVAGVDISPTMIEHCRARVPEAEALHVLDANGRSGMASGSASAVFSHAGVQHISSLWRYLTAFDEMCRVLKPGGHMAVQVSCADFEGGDLSAPDLTENFEHYSMHYRAGETEPYLRHDQNRWSGVYIGEAFLTRFLAERRVKIHRWRHHAETKPRTVWLYARKKLPLAPETAAGDSAKPLDS